MNEEKCNCCRFWTKGPISGAPSHTMGECHFRHTQIWAGIPVEVESGIGVFATEPHFGCVHFDPST